eukprot:Pgem_evm7s19777
MLNDLKACAWSSGKACPKSGKMTFETAMARQAEVTTVPWLQFRSDPFMFHQANLNPFTYNNRKQSLISIWAEQSLDILFKYINKLPVQSPKMDYISDHYRIRMERDNCGLDVKMQVRNGENVGIVVNGARDCQADITIVNNALKEKFKNTKFSKEIYGPELTITVPIKS